MNMSQLSGNNYIPSSNPFTNTPSISQPNYIQQGWQPVGHRTIEDRLSALEKDIKEIKEMLECIKWRV